ncbi:hypothetical protein QFC19_005008 [Naganishia cerealis]|uniref:Uncharacterized protein n=1 Tax=Naganishia cerealis TaxID=610337 RepID=A0ACC2VU15_9TREE|nr:hypothetical protein QFC19_005008 [Naganishia cerealis]
MHGIKRTKLSKEDEDRKKQEDAEQIARYRTMVDECLKRKDNKDYSEEAFALTNSILDFNPEFYTIWNYRRMIMLEGLFPNATSEERYSRLTSDLRLTTSYLKIHPKVYWIWTHRKWCLEHVPSGPGRTSLPARTVSVEDSKHLEDITGSLTEGKEDPAGQNGSRESTINAEQTQRNGTPANDEENDVEGWKKEAWARELMLVEKMLEADSRNCESLPWPFPNSSYFSVGLVHAWDYRRYVLSSLPKTFQPAKTPQTEVRYTTKKIESNFSNFSAWHQRTKELSKIWDSMRSQPEDGPQNVEAEIQRMRQKEFELVAQALWTDPGDQSGWLYHRWLVGNGDDVATLRREIAQIKELLEAEPDSKCKPMQSIVRSDPMHTLIVSIVFVNLGPLESLVHYTQLSMRTASLSDSEMSKARQNMRQWLKDLERIDPFRKERYRELGVFPFTHDRSSISRLSG